MGAFLIARRASDRAASAAARGLDCLRRQGFDPGLVAQTPEADVYWAAKRLVRRSTLYKRDDANFCLYSGTLFYRGAAGAAASRVLFDDLAGKRVRYDQLFGSFCAIACLDGALFYFTDPAGTYCVWHDGDGTPISSSFPAVVGALDRPVIDGQGVYEYVFLESTYGGRTIFRDIKRHRGPHAAAVTGQRPDGGAWRPPDARYAGPADEDSLGREIAGLLRSQFEAIAACFGSNVDAALSGGYDSRLVLAALLAVGVVPRLHVYGREEDADVRVAKRICEAEGWQLRHIDKSKTAPDLDGFADRVRANALAFEGFPPDGIFDSGADLDSRSERGAGGALMLNGGGGEIFRNFHYLADRPLSLREFIWSFYAQFDPRACTARFRGAEFERALGAAMKSELGIDREVLERVEIERLYPYFRCKYWMGRNNSVNNKLGFAATPFVTHALIERALRLPLRAKALGRFEARLIRELHPRLAAYPSAYGHSFAEPPTRRRALAERLSVLRPPWLRRYSFRLRHRRPTPRPAVLQDQFVGRLVDLGFPYLRRFFDVSRVYHHGQYNRLCTLEYLFETCHAADPIAP